LTYTPTTWVDGTTSANAARLNNIESGIVNAALASDAVALATTTPLADTAAGTAGTGITASRGDHAHPATVAHGAGLYGSGAPLGGSVLCVYHQPTGPADGSTMVVNAAGPINALPIYRRQTIKEMNIKIGTAGDASATTAFAIYAVSAAGVITGAPLHTSSFIATTSTGVKTWSSLTMTLDPGLYNIVLNSKGFTSTRPLARTVVGTLPYLWLPALSTGSSTSDTVAGFTLSTVNETSGAFPSSITIGSDLNWTNNLPSAFWYGYQADAA
jgi:hypothetical protein